MKRSVTAEEMKKIDALAREKYGIPPALLMENAGRESALEILKAFGKARAAVFCGKGNNGGDGFVCARYLARKGLDIAVFLLGDRSSLKKGDALDNLEALEKTGVRVTELASREDSEKITRDLDYDFAVDAIFGIGFRGELPESIARVTRFLNEKGKPVYALDVPSGLDATYGKPCAFCVSAGVTITFGLPKTGFFKKEARPFIGTLIVKNIGFPKQLLQIEL